MRSPGRPFRLLALVLAVVLAVTFAVPAPAEALETLAVLAIVTLVVAGVAIIAYLIVANVRGPRMASEAAPRWVACLDSDVEQRACWALPAPPEPLAAPTPVPESL